MLETAFYFCKTDIVDKVVRCAVQYQQFNKIDIRKTKVLKLQY